MKWRHSRKGIIEGKLISENGDFVDIELANNVRMGQGDPMAGDGFRSVVAETGSCIRVRKSFLEELEK